MNSSLMQSVPMLRVLIPLAAGILAGRAVHAPLWITAAVFVLLTVAALICIRHRWSSLLLAGCIFLFGMGASGLSFAEPQIPQGSLRVEVQVMGPAAAVSARTQRCRAFAGAWCDSSGVWHRCREYVELYADTLHSLSAGGQFVCRAYSAPLADTPGSYDAYLRDSGCFSRLYIPASSALVHDTMRRMPLHDLSARMRSKAVERLSRLPLGDDARALCEAMACGQRSSLARPLRKAYSDTGAAHLLAVSGLHVGIVFLLLNVLLLPLPLLGWGHLLRNLLSVAAVWCFVLMTGMSSAALRAAVMFTLLQLSLASGSQYVALNSLCSAAVLMLAADVTVIYDAGFAMSFIAVAAIILWTGPLMRAVRCRWSLLNAVWATVIIGAAASLALAPLAAARFGRVPLGGFLLNPLIMIPAHVTVLVSLLWIVLPLPVMAPVAGAVLNASAGFQNRVVEAASSLDFATAELHLPAWGAWTAYAAMIAFTVILRSIHENDIAGTRNTAF